MEPIINPIWFWLAEVCEGLKGVSIIIAIIISFIFFVILIVSIGEKGQPVFYRKILIPLLISAIVGIACPSQSTCYKMLVASAVTPNNIEAVGNTATGIVDYIVDSVDKILDDEDKEAD